MKFISIQEAIKKKKGKVNIRGWVYRERGSSKFKFIVLRDSTNIIQCVIKKEKVGEKKFKVADKVQVETSMEITGTIKEDKRAPTGYEVIVDDFHVIGESHEYPITRDKSTEWLLDNRHLWVRSRKLTTVFKIRSTVFGAIHEFFRKKGYYETHVPFTTKTSESGLEMFEIDYFGKKLRLAQTWQFYAEALLHALEKIYTIAPSFRAEKSKTTRHLTEYWHTEVEAAWMKLDGLIKLAEELVSYICQKVAKENSEELKFLGRDPNYFKKIKPPFPKITYDKALEILKKDGMKIQWGKDLRTLEERALMKHYKKPLIVTHYPKEAMAFYKPKDPKNPKVALCFDMLVPEVGFEVMGGSERDLSIEEMKAALIKKGENPKDYEWYFDTRKYGAIPHSGFGMGTDRIVQWICGLDDIRDSIPFPRTMLRWKP